MGYTYGKKNEGGAERHRPRKLSKCHVSKLLLDLDASELPPLGTGGDIYLHGASRLGQLVERRLESDLRARF